MLGRALKLLRKLNELSQADLAKRLGISSPYLSQIESGKRIPTIELVEKYAAVFELPVSTIWLFSERLEANTLHEKSRVYLAGRVLHLVEALSSNPADEEEQYRGHEETVSS